MKAISLEVQTCRGSSADVHALDAVVPGPQRGHPALDVSKASQLIRHEYTLRTCSHYIHQHTTKSCNRQMQGWQAQSGLAPLMAIWVSSSLTRVSAGSI
jgi:hypothetical protein